MRGSNPAKNAQIDEGARCIAPRLQIAMAEIVGEGSSVGERSWLESLQHVCMHREGKLCSSRCALNHSQEPSCCDRRALLGREDVRALALQWSQPLDRARKEATLVDACIARNSYIQAEQGAAQSL
jgi:hypothetical protein